MAISRFLCGTFLCAMLMVPAYAADTTTAEKQETEKVATEKTIKPETPVTKLDAATDEMMKGLDENQLKQFSAIENSNGTIRAVEDVQQSIARAVESCSTANPDLKASIEGRFEEWKGALRPVMKKARAKLDKMILLQSFAQPSQVRAYLKKFDAAVIYRNQGITAVPVTEKANCEKLQDSMGKTQQDLVDLLTKSLALNADLKVKE